MFFHLELKLTLCFFGLSLFLKGLISLVDPTTAKLPVDGRKAEIQHQRIWRCGIRSSPRSLGIQVEGGNVE